MKMKKDRVPVTKIAKRTMREREKRDYFRLPAFPAKIITTQYFAPFHFYADNRY